MNRFEQISLNGHQMSLAGGQGQDRGRYNKVQCIMGNGDMDTPIGRMTDWWTDKTETVTFPQLHLGAVIILLIIVCMLYPDSAVSMDV